MLEILEGGAPKSSTAIAIGDSVNMGTGTVGNVGKGERETV